MYDRDCAKIARHALQSADHLVDVIAFVLSTIQTPLVRVAACMADIKANGENAASLWGAKRDGYRYAVAHKDVLYAAVSEAVRVNDAVAAVDVLSLIPSLGMVKAAFVAQMVGLDVSCLDSHNLTRLGLPVTALKFPKKATHKTRLAKIADYVRMTRETGGSRYWWDSWCEYVAARGRMNKRLDTADKVSAFHAECFGLA